MKARVFKTSDYAYLDEDAIPDIREIDSVEDLLRIGDEAKQELVVGRASALEQRLYGPHDISVEIYDSYRE